MANPVEERPFLPQAVSRDVEGLVNAAGVTGAELVRLFGQFGFRLNRVLPMDGSENMTGALVFDPGSDVDMDLLKVLVAGNPALSWDESEDAFSQNKGLRITDGNGVVVGHTTQIDFGAIPEFQVIGTATPDSSMGFARFENNASGPDVRFLKSRSGTIGGNTIVQDGDTLGRFRFQGADGIDFNTTAAEIIGQVDGSPSGNKIPGRIIVKTRIANGSLTEKVRIDNEGAVILSSDPRGTPAANALYKGNIPKAWLNYNQITPVINNSFNVSSVTDHGLGDFSPIWDRDFANVNYGVGGHGKYDSGAVDFNVPTIGIKRILSNPAVGSVRLISFITTGPLGNETFDCEINNIWAFGDQA